MARIEEIVDVPMPVAEVFDYVAAFERTVEWDPTVFSATCLEGPTGTQGATYRVRVRFLGRIIPMNYEILESVRPERLVLRGWAGVSTAVDEIRFEAHEGGTRITWALTVTPSGVLSRLSPVVDPFLGPALRHLGRTAMDGLADALGGTRRAG